jgi:phage gpG-like protein
VSYKIVEKKSEINKMKKMLDGLADSKLKVGFFDGVKAENEKLTVATVAKINEYGTIEEKIPPRPFMGQTFSKHNNFKEEIGNILQDTLTLTKSLNSLFKKFGNKAMNAIQEEITEGEFEKNATATEKKKKSSKPLIDSGQLRREVSWRVEK